MHVIYYIMNPLSWINTILSRKLFLYPIQYSIDPAPVIKLLNPSFYPNKYNFTP